MLHLLLLPTLGAAASRVAVVTGATRGIGRGIALELGRQGFTVYALGRSTRKGAKRADSRPGLEDFDLTVESAAEAINAAGGKGFGIACDCGSDSAIDKALTEVAAQVPGGAIDLLVCSAYTTPPGKLRGDFWTQGPEMWDACNGVGLRGVYSTCCRAAPMLISAAERSGGDSQAPPPMIVLVSSFGGKCVARARAEPSRAKQSRAEKSRAAHTHLAVFSSDRLPFPAIPLLCFVCLRACVPACLRALRRARLGRVCWRSPHPLLFLLSSHARARRSYTFNVAYGVGKAAIDRLASDMSFQLGKRGVATVSLYPGVVKTEGNLAMERRGEWAEASGGLALDQGETPALSGKAVAALARIGKTEMLDKYSGSVQVVAELAAELGFAEDDGSLPPSIRSLQYLAPNFIFPQIEKESGKPVPDWMRDNVPDWKLPWSVFGSSPPPEQD